MGTEFHKIAVFASNARSRIDSKMAFRLLFLVPCRWIGSLNINLTSHLAWQKG